VAPAYRLVLHSSPNVTAKFDRNDHWRAVVQDLHWHIEILPVCQLKTKPYSVKEVHHNWVRPEDACGRLRHAVITYPLVA
jgi:hypothetical protein